jgi:choline dehydrogenase-like flavoprotein
MGADAAVSVTDEIGRVHGTTNLFVGGGAIFVGGSGAVQPTLTMTALALRTADYISDSTT